MKDKVKIMKGRIHLKDMATCGRIILNQKAWTGLNWLRTRSNHEYSLNKATFYMMNWKGIEMIVAYVKVLSHHPFGRTGNNQSLGQDSSTSLPRYKAVNHCIKLGLRNCTTRSHMCENSANDVLVICKKTV
jgi:hypothetical protein